MRRRGWWPWLTGAFVLYMLIASIGRVDRLDEELEAQRYCEMVHLWNTSAGDLGWPDYAGTYAAHCTPAGELRP